jgi:K+-transporting ATPase KdpF subunit
VGSPLSWLCSASSGSTPEPATASETRHPHIEHEVLNHMSITDIAAFIISIALMIFLFYAMLRPEKL